MAFRTKLLRWLDRLPIRWRIAATTAGLTGLILLLFALVIGRVTNDRLRDDFATATERQADAVARNVGGSLKALSDGNFEIQLDRDTRALAGADGVIKLYQPNGRLVATSDPTVRLGRPVSGTTEVGQYRITTRRFAIRVQDQGVGIPLVLQYARPTEGLERTIALVRTFLGFGWLIGTLLALVAGSIVGRRAMLPISHLTSAARRIAETQDPSSGMPQPMVEDEVSELAETLRDMLEALDDAQSRADGALERQREFVADASHELRTPLTAVQANLELLTETTEGDDREMAQAALRSTQRMRRLVSDLLLLARADAERGAAFHRVDLDRVVLEAVSELEPQMAGHEIEIDVAPLTVEGARDELVRVVLNLLGNALRHTPAGTTIAVTVDRDDEHMVVLRVQDDGPGVPAQVRERLFDRFVRGEGDRGGSTGIGLAIVQAVAGRHGGEVHHEAVNDDGTGTRFVIRLPEAPALDGAPVVPGGEDEDPVTQEIDLDVSPSAQLRRAAGRVRRRVRVRLGRGGAAVPGPARDDRDDRVGGAGPED